MLWVCLQNRDNHVSSFLHLTRLLPTPTQTTIIWPLNSDTTTLHTLPMSAFPSHTLFPAPLPLWSATSSHPGFWRFLTSNKFSPT